jgi:hypothetical protein
MRERPALRLALPLASDLLGALAEAAGERVAKSKTWPDGPRALAGRLRRAATFLRKVGIEIGFGREGRARTRTIQITTTHGFSATENAGTPAAARSASSASMARMTLLNLAPGCAPGCPSRSSTPARFCPAWPPEG